MTDSELYDQAHEAMASARRRATTRASRDVLDDVEVVVATLIRDARDLRSRVVVGRPPSALQWRALNFMVQHGDGLALRANHTRCRPRDVLVNRRLADELVYYGWVADCDGAFDGDEGWLRVTAPGYALWRALTGGHETTESPSADSGLRAAARALLASLDRSGFVGPSEVSGLRLALAAQAPAVVTEGSPPTRPTA